MAGSMRHTSGGSGRTRMTYALSVLSLASATVDAHAQSTVAAVGPGVVAENVPMRDVTLLAVVHPASRALAGNITASVATPFGAIPFHGRILLRIDCAGAFVGTVSFNPFVRLLARLKGVQLVASVDGHIEQQEPSGCPSLAADTIRGKAIVAARELRGSAHSGKDSLTFVGPAWTVGNGTHHTLLRVQRAGRAFSVKISTYPSKHESPTDRPETLE